MATADEMEQVREENSFEAGLRRWAQSRPPLDFNTWQQGFSQIRQMFLDRGLDAPKPGFDYTAVASALRDEYMQEIHGPFWEKQLSTSSSGKTLLRPSSKSMLAKREMQPRAAAHLQRDQPQLQRRTAVARLHRRCRMLTGLGVL